MSPTATSVWQDARQAALAAELEAVFTYSVLGPRVSGSEQRRVAAVQSAHEALRDATTAAIAAAGLTPAGPQADYPDAYPAGPTTAAVLAVAVRVEERCAAAWRYLFAVAPSRLRTSAQTALTGSAVRAARWRLELEPTRPTDAFPGL